MVSLVATNSSQNQPTLPINVHDLEAWQKRQKSFEKMGAYGLIPINLSIDDAAPDRFSGGQLTVGAFEAIGVQPILGRGFREGDDRPGAVPVILLGHDVWRDRFHGASDVIGKSLRANGTYRTVIGVMPDQFGFPIRESLWIPLTIDPLKTRRAQGPSFAVIARLRRDVNMAQAKAQIRTIAAQLENEFPDTNRSIGADVVSYIATFYGTDFVRLLYRMLGAGVGVLLIACVNVSNLLVARASMRNREVAVRMALGAARFRIIRQHLTEVLVLAVFGGALGAVLSAFGMKWFQRAISSNAPPFFVNFDLDYHVMLFVMGMIVLASLFAGTLPAMHASRVTAGSALRDESRGATSGRLGRFSSGLVVAELALSCGLLVGAGLMIKSSLQLSRVQMPFGIDHVLTARVDLPAASYSDSGASIRFFEQLLPKVKAIPGIEAATLSDGLPAGGNGTIPVQIEGEKYLRESDSLLAREGIITAGYFATFRTRILNGREFTESDNAAGRPVAVINESFAKMHFGQSNPLGRQFKRIRPNSQEPWLTIVGVVPDLLMQGLRNTGASPLGYYIPIAQSDVANGVRIALRTVGEPSAVAPAVRAAVASLDNELALYEVLTMQTVIDRQMLMFTIFASFFMAFGFCALFLATAGMYGVMSFSVTQRTREMGIRSALGAEGLALIILTMRKSVIQLATGLALGLILALALSGALQPALYHVQARDAAVFITVVATLAFTSLIASFIPARRVTKIDPVIALSTE